MSKISSYHVVVHTLVIGLRVERQHHYVLYLFNDHNCHPTAMWPLLEYFLDMGRSRTATWQRDVCRAVGLFVDYLKANQIYFRDSSSRPQALSGFAEVLVTGTIDRNGDDPSGLYWQAKSLGRAKFLLGALTAFSDWLVNRYDTIAINPWKEASVAEQIAYWRRHEKRRSHALLMHTHDRNAALAQSELVRSIRVKRRGVIGDAAPVKYFPDERIADLLQQGFTVSGKQGARSVHDRLNIRDIMITILLHGGGLRESEPFHLYVTDVAVDPSNARSALVKVFHPEQGIAPEDYLDPLTGVRIAASREEYLRAKWGLEPRNLVVGRFHAGWKDLHLTDQKQKYAQVHWFPSFWGEVFLALFKLYIMRIRSRHARHPYLFVSQKDEVAGDPYTVASYRQAHAKAVKRVGLIVGKDYGTTPHGHRHAYGQLLTNARVDPQLIQKCLHHKSQESQQVYTNPTPATIAATLMEATERLNSPFALSDLERALADGD
ncbi:gamma-mobile-trio recombinase GmtY [Pseudomonas chlororaphis]|uniref:gamma-mobile-trio recombinase GmtY n=1 Tax=Pseudomonas chlororaphis TaxID=587753 RepID=UPI002365BA75|nr:gamma-mobile-trio recombinase GmtY [Pseudomonas chlororaphis]WDH25654.1 gamma-mobile-trio recombinase GmtY [Pseudomonas chlororaphis]